MTKYGSACLATALVALVGACGGTSPATLQSTGVPIAWAPGTAEAANGTAPTDYTAVGTCGSNTETYLAELQHVDPTKLKVLHEWGDVVPGGKQVMVAGNVATAHLGAGDLPTSHPFGDDLSMDVGLDPAFLPFTRALGPPTEPAKQMHTEISSGMIPHVQRPSEASATQTWRQLSDFNLTGLQPGFDKPALGDRALVMGRWIIDCGHPDYNTELHAMSFLAWAHRDGNATVARGYYNPYRDSELYSPDASTAAKPFPPYLVDEILRVGTGKAEHLRVSELMDSTRVSPAPWQVCAPTGTTGHKLVVHYDIVARPGVDVKVVPDAKAGCANVQTVIGPNYVAADAQLHHCQLPWTYLTKLAKDALGSTTDIKALIDSKVPPSFRAAVDKDPDTTCADALAGPTINTAPTGTQIKVDGSQPFPFYGVLTVALV